MDTGSLTAPSLPLPHLKPCLSFLSPLPVLFGKLTLFLLGMEQGMPLAGRLVFSSPFGPISWLGGVGFSFMLWTLAEDGQTDASFVPGRISPGLVAAGSACKQTCRRCPHPMCE